MQKRKKHQTHSNNILYQTRYVPMNIFNLLILPDNVKTHSHLTKIDLMNFLEIYMMTKIRERGSHTYFYTGSLNI